jgi:Mlc titration factor MtfA (ptsG expression regulator)
MSSAVEKVVGRLRGFIESLSVSEDELRAELQEYESYIIPHFTYFRELNEAGKQRFLQRVFWFKKKKEFHFRDMVEEPQMSVLISACAVQITFGLRKYRMPFFKDIYIMPDQYTYGLNREAWAGHVNRTGIYLSWKHFMHGYSVHGDRYNVGLHEMAHALVYVNFLGWFGRDKHFSSQFMLYKKRAEGMQNRLRIIIMSAGLKV